MRRMKMEEQYKREKEKNARNIEETKRMAIVCESERERCSITTVGGELGYIFFFFFLWRCPLQRLSSQTKIPNN